MPTHSIIYADLIHAYLVLADKFIVQSPKYLVYEVYAMGWEARWRILANVITELRRSGESIPYNVINDLRLAKTMIEIVRADMLRPENISRLEEYLSNVESYVLSAAKVRFGDKYVEDVLRRLCELEASGMEPEFQVRFHPGLPRGERWVRVQLSDETPLDLIRRVAEEFGLKCRVEEDGYALVYGDEEAVRGFIKRMASEVRESKKG
ncbi:MAG: DUF2096 family protein [Candidatus Bathyarchaeia archaeon]